MSDDVQIARYGERKMWRTLLMVGPRHSVIPNIATRSFTVSCAGRWLLFPYVAIHYLVAYLRLFLFPIFWNRAFIEETQPSIS